MYPPKSQYLHTEYTELTDYHQIFCVIIFNYQIIKSI